MLPLETIKYKNTFIPTKIKPFCPSKFSKVWEKSFSKHIYMKTKGFCVKILLHIQFFSIFNYYCHTGIFFHSLQPKIFNEHSVQKLILRTTTNLEYRLSKNFDNMSRQARKIGPALARLLVYWHIIASYIHWANFSRLLGLLSWSYTLVAKK